MPEENTHKKVIKETKLTLFVVHRIKVNKNFKKWLNNRDLRI